MFLDNGTLVKEIKKRFVFREDLKLLYDKNKGYNHMLDEIGLCFVNAVLASEDYGKAVKQICKDYSAEEDVVKNDINEFWTDIYFCSNEQTESGVRGGTPSWMDKISLDFPLSLEIELTRACNWNCTFCYNVWRYSENEKNNLPHLSLEQFESIIAEASQNGVFNIRLSGGEPTLHPEFEKIIEAAAKYDMDITLFTNGYNLTAEKLEFLKRNGVRQFLFSMHGLEKIHNKLANSNKAFEDAINAVKIAKEQNVEFVVETIAAKNNISELPRLACLLEELGVVSWSIMPYVETIKDHSDSSQSESISYLELEEVLRSIKTNHSNFKIRIPCSPRHCLDMPLNDNKHFQIPDISYDNHCGAGTLWCSVSHEGLLRHCPHSNVYAGNVSDGIKKIWKERIVPTIGLALQPQDKCKGCNLLEDCKMGCHLYEVKSYDR